MYQPRLETASPLQMYVTKIIISKTYVAQGLPTCHAVEKAVTSLTAGQTLWGEGIHLGEGKARRMVEEITSAAQTLKKQERSSFDLKDSGLEDSSRYACVPLSISRSDSGYEMRIITSRVNLPLFRQVCEGEGARTGLVSARIYTRLNPIGDTFVVDFNALGWLLAAGLPIKEKPEQLVNHFRNLVEEVDERGEFRHPYVFPSMPCEGLMTSIAPTLVGHHQTWSFQGGLMRGQVKYFLDSPRVPFIPGVSIHMSQSEDGPMDEIQESRTSRVYFKLIKLLKGLFPRASI